jgi:deazaflavin-dependent oxidoreductase (nitroreductase family)
MGDRIARWLARLLRTRWIVRLPVWVYRAHLGVLFGGRLLMLQHTGRRSGRHRFVVLEVVDRQEPSWYVVVSGFGERAQWLRNIDVDPEVRVYVRSRCPVPATARRLSTEHASAALAAYRRDHPGAWRSLRPVLEQTLGTSIDETKPALPMVRLVVDRAS